MTSFGASNLELNRLLFDVNRIKHGHLHCCLMLLDFEEDASHPMPSQNSSAKLDEVNIETQCLLGRRDDQGRVNEYYKVSTDRADLGKYRLLPHLLHRVQINSYYVSQRRT